MNLKERGYMEGCGRKTGKGEKHYSLKKFKKVKSELEYGLLLEERKYWGGVDNRVVLGYRLYPTFWFCFGNKVTRLGEKSMATHLSM